MHGFLKPGCGLLSTIMFPPFSFTETLRGCVSLKKQKSQGIAVAVTMNSKQGWAKLVSKLMFSKRKAMVYSKK